jgi:hypothetical protein
VDLRYLAMILNPKPKAPNIMNASFKPTFGTVSAMRGTRSSLVNVRMPVSQKDVPAEHLIKWLTTSNTRLQDHTAETRDSKDRDDQEDAFDRAREDTQV